MSKVKRILVAALAVILIGSVLGIAAFLVYQNGNRNQIPPQETVEPIPAATPEPDPTPERTPEPTPSPPPYIPPDDLLQYQQQNEHVIALIDIPGTDIRYPILMHPYIENYYLDITIEGYAGYPGSIYINAVEGKDFDTFNTVIYGHNMIDGSMFGTLNLYDDPEYMESHKEIHIYTNTREHVYTVAADIIYDDRYITETYSDYIEADRAAFLQSIQGAQWAQGVEINTSSHIITLSTCVGGMPDNRRLIIAVENEEADSASGSEAVAADSIALFETA